MSDSVVVNYEHPGATDNTNYYEFEDREGDQEAEDQEKVPVEWVILMVVAAGIILTGLVIFLVIKYDRYRREQREMDTKSTTTGGTGNVSHLSALAAAQMSSGEDRLEEIERGLVLQPWVAEVNYDNNNKHMDSAEEEAKTEFDDSDESAADAYHIRQSHSNASSSQQYRELCPICRKAFEVGDMVCSSRNQQCRHIFHKSCMFNWLQYQTLCPVCNQEYLVVPLSTPVEGAAMAV